MKPTDAKTLALRLHLAGQLDRDTVEVVCLGCRRQQPNPHDDRFQLDADGPGYTPCPFCGHATARYAEGAAA